MKDRLSSSPHTKSPRHWQVSCVFGISFLYICFCGIPRASAKTPGHPSDNTPSGASHFWSKPRRSLGLTNHTVRIIETEVFTKNRTWVHQNWTDALTAEAVASPSEMTNNASTWLGEWKIAVSSSTSRHGWKYMYDNERKGPVLQYTIRQRTWLRDLQHTTTTTTTRRRPKRSRWLRAIRDDWNFKGFGLSLYKSVVFPKSKGVSFRIPLTYNLGIWERHPAWPSLSLTVSLFHPPISIAINGSASIRMAWLKWALSYWNQWIPAVAASLMLGLMRGLALALSVFLYPITRRSLFTSYFDNASRRTSLPAPQYSQSVEEWVGITWTWRPLTKAPIQVYYWHFYAVQLAALYDTWDWIPRHSAALGWSLVGPVVGSSDLLCTASLCMSLSGFYFRDPHKEKSSPVSSVLDSAETKVKSLPSTSKRKRSSLPKTPITS